MVGGNLVSRKSEKQAVTPKSSAKATYRVVAHECCELLCCGPIILHSDSTLAIKLSRNLVYHKKTKHVDVNCHFIREKVEKKDVLSTYTSTIDHLADFNAKASSR